MFTIVKIFGNRKESCIMKRLLAVLLALTMTLTCAPLSALAASDDTLAKRITVEQTTQPDAELVQAIAADPFMQPTQASAPQQEQSASVDTSDISMTATNSFGKLLLDGMNGNEEENGTEFSDDNRVIGIKMNGGTATVEYVAAEAADLVVAVYTDSAAEEMVASGTVSAPATADNTGSSTVQVPVEGSIPEYYTVKAYLLDKAEHAPLSKVFTDTSKTEAIVDIKNAQVGDFDPDRVINLDDDNTTNFAVVKKNVTLITADDIVEGTNKIVRLDEDGMIYEINNPSKEFQNLQKGDVITYEYDEDELLVVRVKDIEKNENSLVLYGDDTLKLTDVFSAVKIEAEDEGEQLQYSEEGADSGVTMVGTSEGPLEFDDTPLLDETNGSKTDRASVTRKINFTFKYLDADTSNKDNAEEKKDESKPETSKSYAASGTISLSISSTVSYYLMGESHDVSVAMKSEISGDIALAGGYHKKIPLGVFGGTLPGVKLGFKPTVKIDAEVKVSAKFLYQASNGIKYDGETNKIVDISEKPTGKINIAVEGKIYIGIDLGPAVEVLGKTIQMKLVIEVGASATVKLSTKIDVGEHPESMHGCKACFDLNITISGKVGVEIKIFTFKNEETFAEVKAEPIKAYWAPEYKDYGLGDCPHKKYRVLVRTDLSNTEKVLIEQGTMVDVLSGKAQTKGWLDSSGKLYLYLDPGVYTLVAVNNSIPYGDYTFEVKSEAKEFVIHEGSHKEGDVTPGGNTGGSDSGSGGSDNPGTDQDYAEWSFLNGVLTLHKEMMNYTEGAYAPWYDFRNSIKKIVTEENVQFIGRYTFADCSNVTEVTFEYTIVWIDDNAFKNCTALTDVYYPGTMSDWLEVDTSKGNECIEKAKIHCSDGTIAGYGKCGTNLKWILDDTGTLLIVGKGTMSQNVSWPKEDIVNVIIKDGVTNISEEAFEGCINLVNVSLPTSVAEIGKYAFSECTKLESIAIPNGVVTIGAWAFSECENLKEVTISNSVTSIEWFAFADCKNLESIEIPDRITHIETNTFYKCENLKKVIIPDGVVSIGSSAFQECRSLENITLPQNLISIEYAAFSTCTSLKNIVIPDSVTSIGAMAFTNCDAITNISIPEGVTTIESGLFEDCSSLEHITMLGQITDIESYAFYHCANLKEIAIPDSVTDIGKRAFDGCSALMEITIPGSVNSIGEYSFFQCTNLTNVVICDGVTKIGPYMLFECSKVESISVPWTVKEIGDAAFSMCDMLTQILYSGTKEEWNAIAKPDDGLGMAAYVVIRCTDGDITEETDDTDVDSTNAISFGTTTQSSETYHALFSGLTAGEDYAVIVSRSAEQPLKAENLAYIIQLPAGVDGTLDVKFKAQNAEDLSYVVACRRGEDRHSIEVTHGRGSDAEAVSGKRVSITAEDRSKEGYKFSKWAVLSGDVTLANAEQAETTFVMGCQDVKLEAIYVREGHGIRVIDGTADKNTAYKDEKVTITAKDRSSEGKTFVKWNVLAGGVTLADASSPSTTFVMGTQEVTVQAVYQAANTNPGTSGGSGGGGGGGGAIALIGGAAVVAGVVAMLPAKVSGVVLSADAVLPNAAVQLVRKGAVVAQTVTDANGSFTLKAKRGAYQLNITYQDAAGQPVTQSVAVTAPAENLTLRF